MEYKVEDDLRNFPAWSGGKDTLDKLIDNDDCDAVQSLIEDIFDGDVPTDTQINDFLWFDRDTIAELLGYRDWEAYEAGWSEDDLRDAESWFEDLDVDAMEKVSGLWMDDYRNPHDMEEGIDNFIEAVNEWWQGLDDSEKVDIYYNN